MGLLKKPLFPRPETAEGPYGFMKWIFFEADVLGIHPFSRNLTFRGVKTFRTILSLSTVGFLFLAVVNHQVDTFKSGPSFARVAKFLNISTLIILGFPVVIGHMKNCSHLKKSLEKLSRIDDRIYSAFHVEYQYDSRRMNRNMLLWNALKISLYFAFKAFTKREFTVFESANSAVRYYFLFCTYNCTRQFVALGTMLIGHFKILKSRIKMVKRNRPNYLDKICLLHCELIDCCYLSIEWFNQRFFLLTTCYFLGFMYNFCLILADARRLMEDINVADSMAYYTGWQVLRAYELWRLIATCSSIEDEVTSFYQEITAFVATTDPNELDTSSGIVEVFLAKKPDVQFWGSGFFRMDNSALHSMAATLTTCFVIIAQYMITYSNNQGQEK
ncbi:hypothetical protein GE061_002927 [Apolygus lucorum]|uniref:Gustatory receptor n=1 Tax=Apolygus lucorum TaxID=248454 RepID=A0A6A4JUK1_APOLU|nr:hypothetical protein GE061_002927 [Apolygus lucorum]